MLRRKSKSRKAGSRKQRGQVRRLMEEMSLPGAVVTVAISAGAGLWGYAFFNIATRTL